MLTATLTIETQNQSSMTVTGAIADLKTAARWISSGLQARQRVAVTIQCNGQESTVALPSVHGLEDIICGILSAYQGAR